MTWALQGPSGFCVVRELEMGMGQLDQIGEIMVQIQVELDGG